MRTTYGLSLHRSQQAAPSPYSPDSAARTWDIDDSGARQAAGHRMRVRAVVAVNERGRRIGETHHNARLSDILVDQMRDRHEDDGIGYRKLAREFGVALTTVRKICTYERRAQTAERWKTIKVRKAGWVPVTCRPNNRIGTDDEKASRASSRRCSGKFCGSQ